MRTLKTALVTAALALAAAPQSEAQLTGTVIVLNKPAATATFIDLGEARIVATASTGAGPHELVTSSNGSIAVGTDYGGADSSLSVFDVASARRIRTIELGSYTRPHGIAFLPG
ncbi:MAG TPA: hypothetical protein VKQ06_05530, partial [Gammaproteobacteria bacterium]|nr:hypothetical protein [Gammaproteobacteria bacterium]